MNRTDMEVLVSPAFSRSFCCCLRSDSIRINGPGRVLWLKTGDIDHCHSLILLCSMSHLYGIHAGCFHFVHICYVNIYIKCMHDTQALSTAGFEFEVNMSRSTYISSWCDKQYLEFQHQNAHTGIKLPTCRSISERKKPRGSPNATYRSK